MGRDRERTRLSEPAASLYVNYFAVAQNPLEFVLELGQYLPRRGSGAGGILVHTWAAMSPPYAKLFCEMLNQALLQHEDANGPVDVVGRAERWARRGAGTAFADGGARRREGRGRARRRRPP